MKTNNEQEALHQLIDLVKRKRAVELILLKDQLHHTYESLQPMNLVKTGLQELTSWPGIKSNLVDGAIGLATGFLSKKMLVGASHNPIKNILGTVLQFAITNIVAKHPDPIKSSGEKLLNRIFRHKKDPVVY